MENMDCLKMIKCEICQQELKELNWKHLALHGITTKEYKEKYSLKTLKSPECLIAISKSTKGRKPWNTGLTAKTDERVKKAVRNLNHGLPKGHVAWQTGLTKETDERVARQGKAISKARIGIPNPNPHGKGKSSYRTDLNQFFCSTYEANFARILNYLGIEWGYEPFRFKFNDCSWLIDFYLPQFDMFVEVKGWMKPKDLKLIQKMCQEYPNENVKILDGKSYSLLIKVFKDKIENLE